MNNLEIAALAGTITRKYGFNQCRECATALRKTFSEKGLHGSVLRLATQGGRGFIVMRNPTFRLPFSVSGDAAIADSGQHFGVLVGLHVFDNIFREGILRSQWEKEFDCDVHRFVVESKEPF